MTGPHDHADDPLLEELRTMLANDDPVPPLVTEAARAALGWRRLDADLAELLSDSSLEEESFALARGAGAALRSASFSSGALTIDIEIRGEGADLTLLGQLSPPSEARIEVQIPDEPGQATIAADSLGRFRAKLPAARTFRLRIAVGDASGPDRIETSWIAL
ncbi:MAG TPA: hypothetical protein VG295_13045 [Solirubrobacteraceae bacterium]|jgi:hypothetical protein|nr:hypothetical protein [Solirubrobacteraceae bacterium]